MKRTICTFLSSIFFILFFSATSFAQMSDSARELTDTTEPETVADTVLQKMAINTDEDSINDFKKNNGFAYMQYLDSLLRRKKDLAVDTFSIDKAGSTGRLRKSDPPRAMPSPSFTFLNNGFIKIILWALAIFFIGFILYKLFLSDILFKKRSVKKVLPVAQNVEENLSDPSAYDKLISKAAAEKNYRLAIRYLYLQTLQMLAGKGFLQLSPDKTNYQYINEIADKSSKKEFSSVTLNYEYVWYGEFEVIEIVYNKLLLNFRAYQQTI